MNLVEAHAHVAAALGGIAPDVDPDAIDADLHDDLGLDSMDLLNLAVAVSESTGVEIPESEYAGLRTISALQDYIAARAADR